MMWLLLFVEVPLDRLARGAYEFGIDVKDGMSRGEILLLVDLMARNHFDRVYFTTIALSRFELRAVAADHGLFFKEPDASKEGYASSMVARLERGQGQRTVDWIHAQLAILSSRFAPRGRSADLLRACVEACECPQRSNRHRPRITLRVFVALRHNAERWHGSL